MEWIVAGCGAVLTLAAVCIARKKTGLEPSDRKKWLAALLLAGVGGFASGFLLILRVGTYLPNLLRLLLLGAFLAAAAYTDALSRRFAGCTLLDFLFSGMDAVAMMVNGLVSAGVFFLVFFLVRMASHGGVGYGDIKMITAAALIFGVYGTFSFLLTSHVAAALVAIVLLICKKASRKDGLPFGPFFYLGYLATLLMGTF